MQVSLPEELGGMTALESFAAFTNRLPAIPGGMLRRWQGLTRLCLWTNQLEALPPEIGYMHNLQVDTCLAHTHCALLINSN